MSVRGRPKSKINPTTMVGIAIDREILAIMDVAIAEAKREGISMSRTQLICNLLEQAKENGIRQAAHIVTET